jgi:hypothetical protein
MRVKKSAEPRLGHLTGAVMLSWVAVPENKKSELKRLNISKVAADAQ